MNSDAKHFLKIFIYLFILFLAASGLSCGAWPLCCSVPASLWLWHVGLVVVAHRLSCPVACGILIPRPGIEPMSPALEGWFLTTGPPGKSQMLSIFSCACWPFVYLLWKNVYQVFPSCLVGFWVMFFFLNFCVFIYLFLAALGLRCCMQALCSCGEQGLHFVVVCGLPIAVASPVAEHGL